MTPAQARFVGGAVAFFVVIAAFELAYIVLGTPRPVGSIVALVVGSLVVLDPGRLLSDRPERDR